MARLILSAGIFSALAAATAVRKRGFPSGSPPALAAIVISLIRRVKILPRFASRAPFLCLIVAHFEWPDMGNLGSLYVFGFAGEMLETEMLYSNCRTSQYIRVDRSQLDGRMVGIGHPPFHRLYGNIMNCSWFT